MFIVTLTYVAPLKHVDSFVPEHVEYLDAQYALGHFQLSGRMEPRTGGIIIATVASRERLDEVLSQDPFYREKLAKYDVVEMIPSKSSKGLAGLLES